MSHKHSVSLGILHYCKKLSQTLSRIIFILATVFTKV